MKLQPRIINHQFIRPRCNLGGPKIVPYFSLEYLPSNRIGPLLSGAFVLNVKPSIVIETFIRKCISGLPFITTDHSFFYEDRIYKVIL